MKAWLNRIRSWRARSKLRSLQRWEKTRAKGRGRFVVETALAYGFIMVGITDVYENLFYGHNYVSLGHLLYYLLTGIPIAWFVWSGAENEYQRALKEAREKALLSSTTTPQDNP